MNSLLVYGSYGYTGRLVVREAVSRGGSPVVAGRDGLELARQAAALDLDHRVFDLETAGLESQLADVDAVLNCAGPMTKTAEPLVEACLATGTDYLDVTGEFPVFERLRQRDESARAAGCTLLPGVGFDVVPSDCLAAFLGEHVPDADQLRLGVKYTGSFSRGTARTLLEGLEYGAVVRRNGRLISVPAAFRTRKINFGAGPEHAVTIPLGDVVTAPHSTGIESVEVYAAVPPLATRAMSAADSIDWLLEREPVTRRLQQVVDAVVDGPDERELETGSATIWGEVIDESTGRRARGRLRTPHIYAFTAMAAVRATERLLEDDVPAGFQTPASAFGPEFVLEFDGVDRELLEAPTSSDPSAVDVDQ